MMENSPCLAGVLAAVSGLEERWGGLHAECRDGVRLLLELLTGAETPWSQAEEDSSRAQAIWVLQALTPGATR